jgi:hypothetical protein
LKASPESQREDLARGNDQPVGKRKNRDRNRQQRHGVVTRVTEALRDLRVEGSL